MGQVMGWTHEEMLKMPKKVFYRYYGYWYAEQLMKEAMEAEARSKQSINSKPKEWKTL